MPSHDTGPKRPNSRFLVPTLILALILVAALAVLSGRTGPGPDMRTRHARALSALAGVAQMRADLYAAAEAQRGAVLAETDEESLRFANAARTAQSRVSAGLARLREDGRGGDALEAFSGAFDEYRRVDDEVLSLAVRNTNLKALALSFGQAR